jgi:hypothetical protein
MTTTATSICNQALSRIGVRKTLVDYLTDTSQEAVECRKFYELARDSMLSDFWWPFATRRALLVEQPASLITVVPGTKPADRSLLAFADTTAPAAYTISFRVAVGTIFVTINGVAAGSFSTDFGPLSIALADHITGATGVLSTDFSSPSLDASENDVYVFAVTVVDPDPSAWEYRYAIPADCLAPQYLWCGARNPRPEQQIPFDLSHDPVVSGPSLFSDLVDAELVYTVVPLPANFPALFTDALVWKLASELAMPLAVKPELMASAVQMHERVLGKARCAVLNSQKADQPPASEYEAARY